MKQIIPKILWSILLFTLLVFAGGCMTGNAVAHAKGEERTWLGTRVVTRDGRPPDGKPHPGYYWLLPVTIPADVATAPIQILWVTAGVALLSGGM